MFKDETEKMEFENLWKREFSLISPMDTMSFSEREKYKPFVKDVYIKTLMNNKNNSEEKYCSHI